MKTVTITKSQIENFASKWPCANLSKVRKVTAEFADNGDLVDLFSVPYGAIDKADGYAVSAMLDDARDGKLL